MRKPMGSRLIRTYRNRRNVTMTQITEFKIEQDTYPESPREWDNLGTFIMQHGRYEFGDRIFENDGSYISFEEDFKYHLRIVHDCTIKDVIYLPVYMYDHSGISISTSPFSSHWDSGKIGYIYVTNGKVRSDYSAKRISSKLRSTVLSNLQAEIKALDQYVTGNICGFTIEYDDGSINSCWGFYGYNPETNGMFEHWTNKEISYYKENSIDFTY